MGRGRKAPPHHRAGPAGPWVTSSPVLKIEHLTKVYDNGTRALDDVSFEIPDGQFLAVIGLSGSGKSTLLRCINRLIEPTEGRILWDGMDIASASQEDLRHIRRKIGMVFQHFNLVHRSKVMTNVLAGRLGYTNPALSLLNRFSADDIERAKARLERVGLSEKADSRADELSGGQQQRIGIARALMQDPELLLADEPVASLDPVLAHSIMQHLERINQEDEVTLLCSLHHIDLVHRYAERAIALNAGKVVFDGSPQLIDDARFKAIYGEEAERIG